MSKNARAVTVAGLDKQMTNQIQAFKQGQLAKYLETHTVLVCPKDKVEQGSSKKALFLQRSIKISSYTWSGHVSSYLTRDSLPVLVVFSRMAGRTRSLPSNPATF